MRVMISQPMKGKTDVQIRNERQSVISMLEQEGHEVVDTVFEEESYAKHKGVQYLAWSIDVMANVDAVVFMEGWEDARGCCIEYEVARRYGLYTRFL